MIPNENCVVQSSCEYSLSSSDQTRPDQTPTMLFWVSHYSRLKQISLSTWFVGLEKPAVGREDRSEPGLHITFQNI